MQYWKLKVQALSVFAVALMLSACAGMDGASQEKIDQALQYKAKQLEQSKLGPADVVSVSVWRNSDLSVSVPVRPDGKISAPLIGDVQAAGLAPEEIGRAHV